MCDDLAARIVQRLKDRGIYENTILIFASDNGPAPLSDLEELARAGHYPSYHFRGHKADIYEGGHRIPLLIQWPAVLPAGRRCDETVCLADLMATMAECLGIKLPDNAAEDSVSNFPLWKNPGAGPIRKDTAHQSADGSLSIRQDRWKLELCPGSGGWSYPKPGEEPVGSPKFQLYDLETDIGEKQNIINQHPDQAKSMKKRLAEIIHLGRSTPGVPQQNDGGSIWDTVAWLEDC
jgi:arylsulfatase A-like enzyme